MSKPVCRCTVYRLLPRTHNLRVMISRKDIDEVCVINPLRCSVKLRCRDSLYHTGVTGSRLIIQQKRILEKILLICIHLIHTADFNHLVNHHHRIRTIKLGIIACSGCIYSFTDLGSRIGNVIIKFYAFILRSLK